MIDGRMACECSAAGACIASTNPCLLLSASPLNPKNIISNCCPSVGVRCCSLLFVVEDPYWTKSTETQKQPRNNTQNNMHHIINYEEASTDRNTTLPNIEGMHVLLVPVLKGWQGDRRGASQG